MAKIRDGSTYLGKYLCPNDYYSEKEAVSGQWIGRGAERLGLRGEIHAGDKAFENLRCNRLPDGRGKLTPRDGEKRIRFFDFQCSAPKSVSIMGVTLEDDRLTKAHADAVQVAFRELEKFAACQNNTRLDRINRTTGNVTAARFRHTSSRALDPQLHDHIVTANATWDKSSHSWKALTEHEMLKAIRFAGKVYQNELAKSCLSLGYEICDARDGKGSITGFEILGVSQKLIERFSKRRAEIEHEITTFRIEHGREPTNREIGIITRETRAEKLTEITNAEVLCRQRAQLSSSEWSELQTLRARATISSPLSPNRERESLQMATSHLFERRSVAYGHELMAEALNQQLGHLDLKKLSDRLSTSRLIPLSEDQRCPVLGSAFATAKGLRQERWAVEFVDATSGTFQPLVLNASLSERLSEEQRTALKVILESRDQVMSLRGAAGVGKTTVLKELENALELANYSAWYCAPTSSAADTLRQEGISKATTVSDFILNVAIKENLKNAVLIVDEAGLASNKQGTELLRIAARNHARILFVGDSRQHTSVEAGDFLRVLETHSKITSAEILSVRRQTVPEYRAAVQEMAEGSLREGLERFDTLGWIKEGRAEYLEVAAQDYLRYYGNGQKINAVLAVTPSWEENHVLTGIIRHNLKERGVLGEGTSFIVHESLQWTAAQKASGHYEKGLVVTFNKTSGSFRKGEIAEVVGSENGIVRLKTLNSTHLLNSSPECFDVARKQDLEISVGDRLLIRANAPSQKLINGDVIIVKTIVGERIQTSDGRWVDLSTFRNLTHGYVVTSHKSQSKTADHVVVAASQLDAKAAYVACSRGRFSCSLHTPNKEHLLTHLPKGTRTAALDLRQENLTRPPSGAICRNRIWDAEHPADLSRSEHRSRPTLSAFCLQGVLSVAGWTSRWWRNQVDAISLSRREANHTTHHEH